MDYKHLRNLLVNSSTPLHTRFRALYSLRAFPTAVSISIISEAFSDSSVLLKHELAYVLGQMQNPAAIPVLTRVLDDLEEDAMVRHEAGEALGAIGDESSLAVLEKYLEDPVDAVRETCVLAVDRIKHFGQDRAKFDLSLYASHDPAPPAHVDMSVEELRSILLNTDLTLYERYKAMFSLRNKGTDAAVLALCDGLNDSSALFKHEIGYVLGQMQHPASIEALTTVLKRDDADMVRHECAEALGSIANEECVKLLNEYRNDPQRVVSESCIVALDIAEYENSGQFQYAMPLIETVTTEMTK